MHVNNELNKKLKVKIRTEAGDTIISFDSGSFNVNQRLPLGEDICFVEVVLFVRGLVQMLGEIQGQNIKDVLHKPALNGLTWKTE